MSIKSNASSLAIHNSQTFHTSSEPLMVTGEKSDKGHAKCMLSRRDFLLYSGAATAVSLVPITLFAGTEQQQEAHGRVAGYPRKKIAKLSQLINHEAMYFQYPDNGPNSIAMLTKTDIACGGGIGEQRDVVAFSMMCTHQGGPLTGNYKAIDEHRVVGQCPYHLSTFDIRRHGIIVSGQAFESLPQVLLELEGDDIYAVGVMGLIFGRIENIEGLDKVQNTELVEGEDQAKETVHLDETVGFNDFASVKNRESSNERV